MTTILPQNAKRIASNKLYRTWVGMKQRCSNPNTPSWKHYGGKGIKVCDEWQDFEAFRRWSLTNGFNDTPTLDQMDMLSIERKKSNLDYCPGNCEWITRRENIKRTGILDKGHARFGGRVAQAESGESRSVLLPSCRVTPSDAAYIARKGITTGDAVAKLVEIAKRVNSSTL